jgi:hypothetical protein
VDKSPLHPHSGRFPQRILQTLNMTLIITQHSDAFFMPI